MFCQRSLFQQYLPAKLSFLLVVFISLWHLVSAGFVGLSVDEAHYALYGLKHDWSYFDHPPMVGWLQIPFAWLAMLLNADILLRFAPILLYFGLNYLVYLLSFRAIDNPHPWQGFWTLALINTSLMLPILGTALLPELPFLLFGVLTILTLLEIRENPSIKSWILLGLYLGLAGLSKYTAVTLVASVLLIMLAEKRFYWLTRPGSWLAILVAIITILPVIYWNASNEWLSFLYQIDHGTGGSNWDLDKFIRAQIGQLLVYSPLLFLASIYLISISFWRNHPYQFLALFALPVILLFGYGAGHKASLPHWTAFAWLVMAPAVTDFLLKNWHKISAKILVISNAILMLAVAALLNLLLFAPGVTSFTAQTPIKDLHGWEAASHKAVLLQTKVLYETGAKPGLVVTNWTHASRVAWYSYPQPVFVTDTRFDQFDLWFGDLPAGASGLVILPDADPSEIPTTRPGFGKCELIDKLEIKNLAQVLHNFHFYLCQDFRPAK